MKRLKLLSICSIATLTLTSVIPLVSCNKNTPVEKTIVNFNCSDGGTISTKTPIEVKNGTLWDEIIKPKTICNDGYLFDGWYNGDKLLTRTTVINKSMTVTAKFVAISPTIVDAHFNIVFGSIYLDATSFLPAAKMDIYRFNDLPQGYIPLSAMYSESIKTPIVEENYRTTITNGLLPAERQTKVIIDHKNQTITFEDYDEFIDAQADSYGPMTSPVFNGGHKYFNNVDIIEHKKGTPLVIDLAKYNIQTIWFEGKGYVPWEFLGNILSYPFLLANAYLTTDFDFNGTGLYQIVNGNTNDVVTLKKAVKDASGDYYNTRYMEYTYDLLALTLDLRFGMVSRQLRSEPGKTFKFIPDGALKMLLPYHDKLVSTSDDVNSETLRQIFREQLQDGGHSAYMNLNALSTKPYDEEMIYGKELSYQYQIGKSLFKARKEAGKNINQGKAGYYTEYSSSEKGKIAYICFDEFVFTDSTKFNTDEQTAGRALPAPHTTDENYNNDMIRLIMYANDKIQNDLTIKNLVIDLSINGGGPAPVENFIASWLCGGITQKLWNPHTNSYTEYKAFADINGDGTFDKKDELRSDVKLFVITSSVSFSSGNILPCNIKDQKPDTIFIGHNSYGGPCIIDTSMSLGLSSTYRISSLTHFLRLDSSYNNYISMDDGYGTPDWEYDEINHPDAYFNRDVINQRIWNLE